MRNVMSRTRAMLLALALLTLTPGVRACPLCQETATTAVESSDDPLREARAYNRSNFLMLGMPYLLLGVIGYKVYRGLKAADERARLAAKDHTSA
jgi:hypothetical protein